MTQDNLYILIQYFNYVIIAKFINSINLSNEDSGQNLFKLNPVCV